jgi:hypothetical protein
LVDDYTPPKTWNSLLAELRKRPAMFLGTRSLLAFQQFVWGFAAAELIYAIPDSRRNEVEDFDWKAFESYIAARYNRAQLSLNSFSLAQFEAQQGRREVAERFREYPGAWEIWWRWHDEFVDSRRDLAAQ